MKKILIIGGSGYIGREVVSRLLDKRDYKITILSRNPKKIENVEIIKCNLLDRKLLKEKTGNFDIIIYIGGIVRTFMKWKYKENIIGVRNLVDAMKFNNIKKLIYFSTQYVYVKKTGPYGSSKKECDKIVSESGLDYIIIRPNFVYGIDKEQYFYKLANFAKKTGILLVIGSTKRLQPINKEDLAEITVYIIENIVNFKRGAIIDASGTDIVSFNDIADYIERSINKKCIKIIVPLFLLKIFKKIVPFDVDSLTGERLSEKEGNVSINLKLSHNIEDDLKKIAEKI